MSASSFVNPINEIGYTIIEDVIPNELVIKLRREAFILGEAEPMRSGWNERSCFRRAAFRSLLDASTLIRAAEAIVGRDVQILAMDLLRVRPFEDGRQWHRDIEITLASRTATSFAIYLQQTSSMNGPLRVIPGSHRLQSGPPAESIVGMEDEILIPVSAGTAVVHDARLWHSASPNNSDDDCWGLFIIFGPYWIKRRDCEFQQPLPSEFLLSCDPLKRQLLGLGLRADTPTLLGDPEEYNRRGDPGIDFPTAKEALNA